MLAAIGTLRNNSLLNVFKDFISAIKGDKQMNIQRPVLNIVPLDVLMSLMKEILVCVGTIQRVATKLQPTIVPRFPSSTLRDDVSPKVADARFAGEPGPSIFIGESPPGSTRK